MSTLNIPNLPSEAIRDITITKDNICIICDEHIIYIDAYGDCCSYSYIRYYDSMVSSIGKTLDHIVRHKIDSNNSPDYPSTDGDMVYYDYDRYEFNYTDGTTTTLELVNESNGYYNGWLEIRIDKRH